jgi:hypothetical protein
MPGVNSDHKPEDEATPKDLPEAVTARETPDDAPQSVDTVMSELPDPEPQGDTAESFASKVEGDPVYPDEDMRPEPPVDAPKFSGDDVTEPSRPRSGGSFLPALLGGVLAAGLGFGAAYWLDTAPFGKPEPGPTAQALSQQGEKLTALEQRLDEIGASLSAQTDRGTQDALAAIGDRIDGGLTAISGRLDTVAGSIGSVENRLGQLDTRLTAVEKRPLTESSEAAQAAFDAYERELEALRGELDAQKAANAEMSSQLTAAAEATKQEISAAEQRAREMSEQAEASARRAALRNAVAELTTAVGRGDPFTVPLGEISQSVEVPPALSDHAEAGIAPLSALRDEFPALARDALDASRKASVPQNPADRIGVFLRSQTGARSLEPREGSDPDAVLSRAEAALRDGDLAACLTEIAALPPEGQQVFADWAVRAQQRIAATEALAGLANQLQAN